MTQHTGSEPTSVTFGGLFISEAAIRFCFKQACRGPRYLALARLVPSGAEIFGRLNAELSLTSSNMGAGACLCSMRTTVSLVPRPSPSFSSLAVPRFSKILQLNL